jgi:ferritin
MGWRGYQRNRGVIMIGKSMQDALNQQINEELYSEYIYLSMGTYFHAKGLDGMAQWIKAQAAEERSHAMKMFDHIVKRGGRVELMEIKEPPRNWDSPLDVWKAAYNHEVYITGKIKELVKVAEEEKDDEALGLLQYFVDEQVEEEENASKNVKMAEEAGNDLAALDEEMGKRE